MKLMQKQLGEIEATAECVNVDFESELDDDDFLMEIS